MSEEINTTEVANSTAETTTPEPIEVDDGELLYTAEEIRKSMEYQRLLYLRDELNKIGFPKDVAKRILEVFDFVTHDDTAPFDDSYKHDIGVTVRSLKQAHDAIMEDFDNPELLINRLKIASMQMKKARD